MPGQNLTSFLNVNNMLLLSRTNHKKKTPLENQKKQNHYFLDRLLQTNHTGIRFHKKLEEVSSFFLNIIIIVDLTYFILQVEVVQCQVN